jgi:hypothetical protein
MKITILTTLILGFFACKNSTENKTRSSERKQDKAVEVDSFSNAKSAQTNNENLDAKETCIDPTGTYELNKKTADKDDNSRGYSGYIQVKKITADKIVMTFEVNKGAPSYNSGSFVDTLRYSNNIALYAPSPNIDSTCLITFHFDTKGVSVKEKTADYNSGCGFGHAVVADGFYNRTSNKTPVLKEPLTGEKIGE